jgi:hypothetical protein
MGNKNTKEDTCCFPFLFCRREYEEECSCFSLFACCKSKDDECSCFSLFACYKTKDDECVGCFGPCYYEGKKLKIQDEEAGCVIMCFPIAVACNMIKQGKKCISPCFCFKKEKEIISLPGTTESKEVNDYIEQNNIRTQEVTKMYHTFGQKLWDESPPVQSMCDEHVKIQIAKELAQDKIQSMPLGDGPNLSNLIMGYV